MDKSDKLSQLVEERYLAKEDFLYSEINFLRKCFFCGSVYIS